MKKNYEVKQRPFDGHEFKKSLGQNFIKDTNLLAGIVRDAGINSDDIVIEVGAGAGTLTNEIAKVAKGVLSFEVDHSLENTLNVLQEKNKNLKVVFLDALKTSEDKIYSLLEELKEQIQGQEIKNIKIVANIPYYITTPLIFKFLKMQKVESITIMVQKEVAERVVSKTSTGEYGALSVMVNYYGESKIKRIVDKSMFYPVPKVDSAVLRIDKYKDRDELIEPVLTEVVKFAFSQRRKMLVNNLERLNFPKDKILEIFGKLQIKPTVRAEELTTEQFILLSKEFVNLRQI